MNDVKSHFLIFLTFLAVGVLILVPMVLPHSEVSPGLHALAVAILVTEGVLLALVVLAVLVLAVVVAYQNRQDRKADRVPSGGTQETRIQVLGGDTNRTDEFTADHYGQGGVR